MDAKWLSVICLQLTQWGSLSIITVIIGKRKNNSFFFVHPWNIIVSSRHFFFFCQAWVTFDKSTISGRKQHNTVNMRVRSCKSIPFNLNLIFFYMNEVRTGHYINNGTTAKNKESKILQLQGDIFEIKITENTKKKKKN